MSKITGFDRPNDLLIKLLREGSRLRFETDDNNRIDHFFNFSVTAHSLRDWCAEALCLNSSKTGVEKLKNTIDKSCNEITALLVARDIANSVKHFKIRQYSPKVANAQKSTAEQKIFEFTKYSNTLIIDDDNFKLDNLVVTPSIDIIFNDQSKIGLDQFIIDTISYWIRFFDENSIYRDLKYQASFIFFSLESWPTLLDTKFGAADD